ncbi:MAG TPA: hypothetical protein VH144_00355 [Candidatus Saccharimonadales bacterium]|nr:hypothetical protein [Candidatus Saccharimonadales bacterium]
MPRRNPAQPIPRRRVPPTCDNKRRYATEAEAIAVKEHQELLNMSLTLRVYQCPISGCGGWHLTRAQRL